MKKYTLKLTTFFILSIFSLSACTDDFEETNENPNLVTSINAGSLMNPVIYNMGVNNALKNYDITSQLMQVHIPFPSNALGMHRYDVTENSGSSTWNTSYKWLINIQEMIAKSNESKENNYEAIGLTLRAWMMANLTDMFGDVPFTEASQGEQGNFKPKFDKQEEIYATILSDLEKANSLYTPTTGLKFGADILYNGDVSKWRKLTNSLHLRLLLRTSNRTGSKAYTQLQTILNNPANYPIFTSQDDDAILRVTGITPNLSPWPRPQDYRDSRAFTSYFVDELNATNDPRLPIVTSKAKSLIGEDLGYKGIPAAYDGNSSDFKYTPSVPNNLLVQYPMKIIIMTYAETEFIKAELAQKNYYSDPEVHYLNGIKAAIKLWTGIEPSTTYLTHEKVAYNGNLERIIGQKYIALFFTDYQQWYEHRRTGFPKLPTTTSMENNKQMPSRLLYPVSAKTYNQENYKKAVAQMGGDNINTRVWWQN